MWYLLTSTGKRLYLQTNKEVTFGRKKSDILLKNDESISRLHATICVKPKDTVKPNEPISVCELKDNGSKYGTYIILSNEGKKEVTKEGYKLMNGDKVRFGLQQHVFTVVYVPLITVVTNFSDSEKQKLQGIFDEIDGMISNEWSSACTHLTASRAALTEKIVWAMASAVPIVSLNYWVEVKHATNNGEKLPDPTEFVPPLTESLINKGLVSLCVNEKRKTLFRNLIFVHFSVRQYKIYGRMINMAGGKSLLYSKKPLTTKEICAPNVIVLQYSDGDATQSTQGIVPEYETIYNSLQAKKRNMVSETEIVLAILHCSTEKYCNPKFNFVELLKRSSQLKSDSSKVLVLDTQDLTSDVRVLPKVISNVPITSNVDMKKLTQKIGIIPESCDSYRSTGDLSQLSDVMRSSSSKGMQITKISNNDITIERRYLENFEEIHSQKAVKYIPETNDSSQTQDRLKTNTSTASQNTRSILNNNDRIERVKQVSSQKIVKCIPETNDSSQSQDIISTPKINQDTKSTHNNDISIESKLPQSIKNVHSQRTLRCIPETNDSSQSQEIISTRKINQDTKSTNGSDNGSPQETLQCIPESNDLLESQEIPINRTPNMSQSTKSSSNSNTSIGRIPAQRVEEIHLRRTPKCIPKSSESSLHESSLVRNEKTISRENGHIKESTTANKETPLNDVIKADGEDDEEEAENKLEELLFSQTEASQRSDILLNQSELDKLVHDNSIRSHSTKLNTSQMLASGANCDDSKKSRKRNHSSDGLTSDENCQASTARKRLCTEASVTENVVTLPETVNSAHTEISQGNTSPQNDIVPSSTDEEPNSKKFVKVPRRIFQMKMSDSIRWGLN